MSVYGLQLMRSCARAGARMHAGRSSGGPGGHGHASRRGRADGGELDQKCLHGYGTTTTEAQSARENSQRELYYTFTHLIQRGTHFSNPSGNKLDIDNSIHGPDIPL